jgi:hypothetical protein
MAQAAAAVAGKPRATCVAQENSGRLQRTIWPLRPRLTLEDRTEPASKIAFDLPLQPRSPSNENVVTI